MSQSSSLPAGESSSFPALHASTSSSRIPLASTSVSAAVEQQPTPGPSNIGHHIFPLSRENLSPEYMDGNKLTPAGFAFISKTYQISVEVIDKQVVRRLGKYDVLSPSGTRKPFCELCGGTFDRSVRHNPSDIHRRNVAKALGIPIIDLPPAAVFSCTTPNCTAQFHRKDLLQEHINLAHRTPAATATATPSAADAKPARKRKGGATVPAARKRARLASPRAEMQGRESGQVARRLPETAAHAAPSPRTDGRHFTPLDASAVPPPRLPPIRIPSPPIPRVSVQLEPYAIPESAIGSREPLEMDALEGLCLAVLQERPIVPASNWAQSPTLGVTSPPRPLVQDACVTLEACLSSLTPLELDVLEGICLGLLAGRPIVAVADPIPHIYQPP